MNIDNKITPKHVAIIMDGNGRWAKARGKERIEGHYAGVKALREVIKYSLDANIEYLTVYAFSTENWARPQAEVDGIMELFCATIAMEVSTLQEQGVSIKYLGSKEGLSDKIVSIMDDSEQKTATGDKMMLCVALNYSSCGEMVDATKKIAAMVASKEIKIDEINAEMFGNNLYTNGIPDPDLLIRTSGEQRLSNFLLWQLSYAEFYFTECFWPDFTPKEYSAALESYASRCRRYGKSE